MNEKEFMKFKVGDLVEVNGRSINYGGKREDHVVGYVCYTRARGGYEGGSCIPRIDLKLHISPMYPGCRHTVYFNVHDITSMRKIIKEKVMGKYDITVDEAVKLLDSRTNYNQGFIIMCNTMERAYILVCTGRYGSENQYEFKSFERAAYYMSDLGVSSVKKKCLKEYLIAQLVRGGKLYYTYSYKQLVEADCSLPQIVLEKTHTINIDGKDIEISDKSFINLKKSLIK